MWQPDSTVVLLSLKLSQDKSGGRHTRNHTHSATTTYINGDAEEYVRKFHRTIPPMGASSMWLESKLLSRGGTKRLNMVWICRAGRQVEN